jgi:hypothetical protein
MRRMLIAVPLILLAGLAACGGNGEEGPGVATVGNDASASASPDPSAPAADEEERKRQFTDCMRAEGVDMDDFKTEGGGIAIRADKAEMQGAMQKCRKYLPNGGEPPKLSPEDIEKMREYAKCMRENGVPDFPDPDPESGGIALAKPADGTGTKEDIQKADEKCRDKLPEIRKGGGK